MMLYRIKDFNNSFGRRTKLGQGETRMVKLERTVTRCLHTVFNWPVHSGMPYVSSFSMLTYSILSLPKDEIPEG